MATFDLFVRMALALGVTLGLLFVAARVARRLQGRGGRLLGGARTRAGATPNRRQVTVEVLARRPISKTSALSVIRVGGRLLVVGATAQSVNLLAELEESELDADDPAPNPTPTGNGAPPWTGGQGATLPSAWDAAIAHLRERTVRH